MSIRMLTTGVVSGVRRTAKGGDPSRAPDRATIHPSGAGRPVERAR